MMRTYEFDDAVLSPERFRFHVLRVLSVRKHLPALLERQERVCLLCNGRRGPHNVKAHVDHIKSVKSFAYDLQIPLMEAYEECHAPENLRAVHQKCNSDRNRKRKNSK